MVTDIIRFSGYYLSRTLFKYKNDFHIGCRISTNFLKFSIILSSHSKLEFEKAFWRQYHLKMNTLIIMLIFIELFDLS